MRKLAYFVMALALMLGLAQCKKDTIEGEQVRITLELPDNNKGDDNGKDDDGSKAEVDPPHVNFEDGDKILVASNGKYVGYLQRDGGSFSGTITDPVAGVPLYFYFLGNKINVADLTPGTTDQCTVNLSDQTECPTLPVISMGVSTDDNGRTVNYSSSVDTYRSRLYDKCSLQKFEVYTPSTAAICITGMYNEVTVDFTNPTNSGFTYSMNTEDGGLIKMKGVTSSNRITYAIVLPQPALPEGDEGTIYTENNNYTGTRPLIHKIDNNTYYSDAIRLELETPGSVFSTPLTFEAKTAGAVVTFTASTTITPSLEYSIVLNNSENNTDETWVEYSSPITLVNVGDKVSFRAISTNNTLASVNAQNPLASDYSNFSFGGECYIYGNVMSLLKKEGFDSFTEMTNANMGAFGGLFSELTDTPISALYNHPTKDIVLPATTLAPYCYTAMFAAQHNLTRAPELPAMTMQPACYLMMFRYTGLATAPELPATTLAPYCYAEMFEECNLLTDAPEILPATTLAVNCYQQMFKRCSSLTTAPVLPATTLVANCYEEMFNHCRMLNYIDCRATTISATDCTKNWVESVASTGTFVKADGIGVNVSGGWSYPSVDGIPQGWWDDSNFMPLTFEAKTTGSTVKFTAASMSPAPTLQYYKTGSTGWEDYTGTTIYLNAGDKISFRGENSTLGTDESYSNFNCTGECYVYGNVMSLLSKEGYVTANTVSNYAFKALFNGNTSIYSHDTKDIVLPATTLAPYCYYRMFRNCTNLTKAPAIPATTVAPYCCREMFSGCTSLCTSPEILPATTLAIGCYYEMFASCSSLTSAPALPATTLADACYRDMFLYCTNLTKAPVLPATTMVYRCYLGMFQHSGLTEAPTLPATTLASNCYYCMFAYCSNLAKAPALPATTLQDMCYGGMFEGCTSLTTAPALPATTLASGCYSEMFQYCTSLTTAPELPAPTLSDDCYLRMFENCTSLNYIKCLATDISASDCTTDWVKNVAPTGTFVKAGAMNDWEIDSNNGIPIGWTPHVTSRDLPLTFEAKSIYSGYDHINVILKVGGYVTANFEYSLDGGDTWNSYTAGSCIKLYHVGDKVSFRGDNPSGLATYLNSGYDNDCSFHCNPNHVQGDFYVYGNVMSLLYKEGFETATTVPAHAFHSLFFVQSNTNGQYSSSLYSHPDKPLVLPATTLGEGCYKEMFLKCDNMTKAPELPATTLAPYCYQSMFAVCPHLTSAPVLPATTVVRNCYASMFDGCESLTTAPVLPASTLAESCYYLMFGGCTSLNYIKCLATDISAHWCTTDWFYQASNSGTFVKSASMTSWPTGISGIPSGWTVVDAD